MYPIGFVTIHQVKAAKKSKTFGLGCDNSGQILEDSFLSNIS